MDEILWEGEPLFSNSDMFAVTKVDPVLDHFEKTGRVKIDMLATERVYHAFNAWEDNVPVEQPPNSRMKMIAGVDPAGSLHSQIHVAWLYYFMPDGYWPPIETIEEWASSGFSRRCHRIEHESLLSSLPAKYQRVLLFFALLVIWWIVYGADKILG